MKPISIMVFMLFCAVFAAKQMVRRVQSLSILGARKYVRVASPIL